jgi:hypothetical protein
MTTAEPGSGSTQFSAYEEDDAAVGQATRKANIDFAFVRNVPDTVVPDHTRNADVIPKAIRTAWAGFFMTAMDG